MYKRILVPVDGTERGAAALGSALGLAKLGGGTIVGVHVATGTRSTCGRGRHA
ncbi:universal stress protein [Massilia sp. CT11-108]|uniref:universal stress protein n=1 Tax=Massilia sp. CT11-108 TaxID=3393900 RepID=UPI0039A46E69